ncbi:hypothetical protein QJS04_geneDACA004709 [Acorus gramineus]|uniref:Thioesterase domain-containing protein n=1 Tax=Acorus gramineus TaxID=55184 RepID=A0AAV9BUT1_ACOGR|nr:hypothetical protein QJS04_geneDACA004709 [Acorus gramineus]
MSNPKEEPPASKTAAIDRALYLLGFEIGEISPEKITGQLKVTENCSQPFKVLNGGVSALIAETLASLGAHMTSGFQRVAGVQLSINHIKPAMIGDLIVVEAKPVTVGKKIQVWEVQQWKVNSLPVKKILISTARVTLLCNLPVPEHARAQEEVIKKYAKL